MKNNMESSLVPVKATFSQEHFSLILEIEREYIDTTSRRPEAERIGLGEKADFHITVFTKATGREVLGLFGNPTGTERESLGEKIRDLGESIDWKAHLNNEFYYVRKYYDSASEKRESIIQMAEVSEMEAFYAGLEELFGEEFVAPVPHVTLYTTSNREDNRSRGIGIDSVEEFRELGAERI